MNIKIYRCLVLASKKSSNRCQNKQSFPYRLKWSSLKECVGGWNKVISSSELQSKAVRKRGWEAWAFKGAMFLQWEMRTKSSLCSPFQGEMETVKGDNRVAYFLFLQKAKLVPTLRLQCKPIFFYLKYIARRPLLCTFRFLLQYQPLRETFPAHPIQSNCLPLFRSPPPFFFWPAEVFAQYDISS